MKRRILYTCGAIFTAALIAAGCGSSDDSSSSNGDGDDFSGDVTIGAIISLTGGLGDFGKAGEQAANLAVEQINAAQEEAGLDGTVELVVEDDETEEDAAKAAAEKLVRSEDVSCIAGAWASTNTTGVAKSVTIDAGVPLISPSSTDPAITDLDDDGLVFRTAPSDLLQSQVLAEQMADELDEGATISLAGINNDYGAAFLRAFGDAAEKVGFTVTEPILYDPKGTQFDTEAKRIVEGDPDAYVIIDYPDQAFPRLAPALVRTGSWSPDKTWTADGLRSSDLPEQLGEEVTEGMRGTAPGTVESGASEAFSTLWEEEADGDRQTYDSQNFDAVMLCYLAAVAAGSTEPGDIADQLQDVSSAPGTQVTLDNLAEGIELLLDGEDIDYEGASGPINFDDNGDPTAATYDVWAYMEGVLETIKSVPFGDEASSEDESMEGDSMEDDSMEGESMEGESTEGDSTEDEPVDEG